MRRSLLAAVVAFVACGNPPNTDGTGGGAVGGSSGTGGAGTGGGTAGGTAGGDAFDGGQLDAGADAGELDAGAPDAGAPDAGAPDAGAPDAGTPDAGESDAGEPDAGEPDAGEPDAGEPDAGAPDAGEPDAGEPDAGVDAGMFCSAPATLPPLDVFVMLDQSGSMGADCNIGSITNSNWCNAINALSTWFARDAGHAAALQYFDNNPGICTGVGHTVSSVPASGNGYVSLPTTAFNASLNAHLPMSTTPTESALRGIAGFTRTNVRSDRTPVGLLITDGDPNACDTNITSLATILQAHYATTRIRTYVIGLYGSVDSSLEQLATAGGGQTHYGFCGTTSPPCRHWQAGSQTASYLNLVMREFERAAAYTCKYLLPAQAGPNPTLYERSFGSQRIPLTRVNDSNGCSGTLNGYWHLPFDPTAVMLCPYLCDRLFANSSMYDWIEVSWGC